MPHSSTRDFNQCTVPDFVTELIRLDRQSGQPCVPPDIDEAARRWLIEVLLDWEAWEAHREKLKAGYGGKFRQPRPHWERPWEERIVPDPASGFQWFDLLPEEKVRSLLDHGPVAAVLDAQELARLLLNPFGLCDLAERIDAELSPWWLQETDRRGKELLKKQRIRLRLPCLPGEMAKVPVSGAALSSSLVIAGLRQGSVDPNKHGTHCWPLIFGHDIELLALRRDFAEKLYGNRDTEFTFRLFAHRPTEENAPVPFSLEVEPAPTQGPVTVQLEFPGDQVRSFVLEVPESFPGVDPPESFRSARCAPVPAEALTFSTITWGEHPDDRHLLRS